MTYTMIALGVPRRHAIETANAVVFFVALIISVALWVQLRLMRFDVVLALVIEGTAAAPVGAYVTRHIPHRAAAVAGGVIVFVLWSERLVPYADLVQISCALRECFTRPR